MLIRITSPYFCAGYDIPANNIAPIINYMRGWHINKIRGYCTKKRWKLEVIKYYAEPDGAR